jgi:CopG family nickel-responsive transcriptional regulator
MELFVLEGGLEEISAFVGKVRATKETLTVDYSVTPVDEFGAGALGDAHAHGGHGSGASEEAEGDADATAEANEED